jgi:hypothetical protein
LSWTCTVCGEEHEEQLRDIRSGLPEPVFVLTEAELEERAEIGDDWCRLVDAERRTHFYVRGVLHLPIERSREDFRFGVWIEIDEPDFYSLGELWHDAEQATRPFFGRLANELNLYPGTTGLAVALQLRAEADLPAVILLDSDHELVASQRRGIDEHRAQQLAETVLH